MASAPKQGKKNKESRPARDEFELIELGEKLSAAMKNNVEVQLVIWKCPKLIKGKIVQMNVNTRQVYVQTLFNGLHKVSFMDIMQAADAE